MNGTLALAVSDDVHELVQSAGQVIQRLRPAVPAKTGSRSRPAAGALARNDLRDALEQGERLKSYLLHNGVPPGVLATFEAWMKLNAAVEVAQMPAAAAAAQEDAVDVAFADPFEPLTAAQLGGRLGGLVPESVRLRERAHALFSTLPPGRERGRAYPAFQAWPEIVGGPLRRTLEALGEPDGTAAYGFFASTPPELDGLTPVEALCGRLVHPRTLAAHAHALLKASSDVRLDAVTGAARTYAADRAV